MDKDVNEKQISDDFSNLEFNESSSCSAFMSIRVGDSSISDVSQQRNGNTSPSRVNSLSTKSEDGYLSVREGESLRSYSYLSLRSTDSSKKTKCSSKSSSTYSEVDTSTHSKNNTLEGASVINTRCHFTTKPEVVEQGETNRTRDSNGRSQQRALEDSDSKRQGLCSYCLEDEKRTTATHFCKSCGDHGRNMCFSCLRCHTKFTTHDDVLSLSIMTSHPDVTVPERGDRGADDFGSNANTKEETAVDNFDVPYTDQVKFLAPVHDESMNVSCSTGGINQETSTGGKSKSDNASQAEKKRNYTYDCHFIDVTGRNDIHDCTIVDFTMMVNGDVLLADFHNRSLKVVNTDSLKLVKEYTFESRPLSVACLENDTVVIAFEENVIVMRFQKASFIRSYDLPDCDSLKSCGDILYILSGQPGVYQRLLYPK